MNRNHSPHPSSEPLLAFRKPRHFALIIILFWTVVSIVSSIYYNATRDLALFERPWTWPMLIVAKLCVWYLWALVTIGILWFGRKVSPSRVGWWRWGVVHIAVSAFLVTAYMLAYTVIILLLRGQMNISVDQFLAFFGTLSFWHHSFFFLAYWLTLGVDYGISYYRQLRAKENREAELQRELVEAQLTALRAQLQPHFLFNTLNMIAAMVRSEPATAEIMLARLGSLLRKTLTLSDVRDISLGEELELTRLYLEIQEARFQERLQVRYDFAKDDPALGACLPPLLLQPIIENAVRYGVSELTHPLALTISVAQTNGAVKVTVRDNGPGFSSRASAESGNAVGLANVRRRLAYRFPHNHDLTLSDNDEGGAKVQITFPFEGVERK